MPIAGARYSGVLPMSPAGPVTRFFRRLPCRLRAALICRFRGHDFDADTSAAVGLMLAFRPETSFEDFLKLMRPLTVECSRCQRQWYQF